MKLKRTVVCESRQPSYVGGMKQKVHTQELLSTDILLRNSSVIILPSKKSRREAKMLRAAAESLALAAHHI